MKIMYFVQNLQKCFSKVTVVHKSALIQEMDWRRTGEKVFPEQMMTYGTDAYSLQASIS